MEKKKQKNMPCLYIYSPDPVCSLIRYIIDTYERYGMNLDRFGVRCYNYSYGNSIATDIMIVGRDLIYMNNLCNGKSMLNTDLSYTEYGDVCVNSNYNVDVRENMYVIYDELTADICKLRHDLICHRIEYFDINSSSLIKYERINSKCCTFTFMVITV